MKLTTKFDLTQTVFFMHDNKVVSGNIWRIDMVVTAYYDEPQEVRTVNNYSISDCSQMITLTGRGASRAIELAEGLLYATKEELLATL